VPSPSNQNCPGPHEIIANGKWEQALFTTYALSLTFFETYILKAGLIRNGCQSVWVVADVDGYQQSLTERQSARVGQEYHLIPVALPDGVFHPKCIYLSGPSGDVLLVGSGNLTFGGFGRNVEVVEVLTAAQCPGVFHAFGQYLQSLGARKNFLNPDPRWINIFSDLAITASKGVTASPPEGPHLVHCVTSAIADQLADRFAAAGGASKLRILSPFYDQDAHAVRDLATKADCKRLTIGLLPGREEESTFPFDLSFDNKAKLEAAVVGTEEDGRPLHAKWLEADLKDGRRLTLAGSVNATRKAMCTTDNVEVGLLRLQPAKDARFLTWEPAAVPKRFQRRRFTKAGLGNRWVVHARFSRDTLLEGVLLGLGDPAGTWESYLARADGERTEFTVTVGQDGKFQAQVPHAEHYATATAVQIVLRSGNREAVGWLQLEAILNLPRLPRLGITSLVRWVNNEQTEEDDAALLEYFALSAQHHLLTFKLQVKPRAKTEPAPHHDDGDNTLRVDLHRLAPTTGEQDTQPSHSAFSIIESSLDAIFARLRRRILTSLGTKGGRHISGIAAEEHESEDNGDGQDTKPETKKVKAGLAHFNEKMRELAAITGPQDDLKAVFNMWLEIELLMRLERLKDIEGAESFSRTWVRNAVQRCRKEAAISTFDRHLITIAATLTANILSHDPDEETQGRLVQLHEDIERYCAGPVPRDFATSALATDTGFVVSQGLLLPQAPALPEAIERLLATRTFRQELDLILSSQASQPLPDDLQILLTPAGKSLAQRMNRTPKPTLLEFKTDRNSCPKCHLELNRSVRNELMTYRISQCLSCGRFIINRA
jgi:hypothetical protein